MELNYLFDIEDVCMFKMVVKDRKDGLPAISRL